MKYDPIFSLIDTNVAANTDDFDFLIKVTRNYSRMIGMEDMQIDVPLRLFLSVMENPLFDKKIANLMMMEINDIDIKRSLIEHVLRKKMPNEIFMEMYNLFPKSEVEKINPTLLMASAVPTRVKLDYISSALKSVNRTKLPYICYLAINSKESTREMLEAIYAVKDGINLSKHTKKMLEEKISGVK